MDLPIKTIKTCNIDLDATVFGSAQNKPNMRARATDVPVSAALLAAA
jgi:hypothetical protein